MAKFQKKASKLHHLLSTSSVSGIYRSPYQALTNTVPLLDSIPIEDQIRANRKSLVRHRSVSGLFTVLLQSNSPFHISGCPSLIHLSLHVCLLNLHNSF